MMIFNEAPHIKVTYTWQYPGATKLTKELRNVGLNSRTAYYNAYR
jgi:hypothetical protein